jgi:ABC-type nitrate/sulfonate/bicarbonate transport system ATPase subunit
MLEVENLSMQFERDGQPLRVLDRLSLTVRKGEFVSVIGPSGSGKSTLFHLIGGLYRPTAGTIRIDGRETTGERGHISYMPQHNSLFPWLTIEQNVLLAREVAAGMRKRAKDEARLEAREWLRRVGLAGYEGAYPHQLSGGMQQRAAFVRALLSPRELMCLDEPFGALDALTRHDMQQWLLRLWEEHQRTILFVTHSIEEALLLSDRIYVLSARPAVVLREIAIPFGRPRPERLTADPAFQALRLEIHDLLRPNLL